MMGIKTTIRNEQTILRGELQQLKKCQLQYFVLTLAAVGAVFGFHDIFQTSTDVYRSMIFLAPLLVIIPCWLTFFDKATTITRLTGYTRILEEQLRAEKPYYVGYESALSLFRELEEEGEEEGNGGPEPPQETSKARHSYWVINWRTFCALSLVCVIASLSCLEEKTPIMFYIILCVFLLITVYSGYSTYKKLNSLIEGHFSYDNMANLWEERVLSPENLRERYGIIVPSDGSGT